MKTVNFDKRKPSLDELLAMARDESILLIAEDGRGFVLEEVDDFERDAAELGPVNDSWGPWMSGRRNRPRNRLKRSRAI